MQGQEGPNFSYVIPVDDAIHTDQTPFCPIDTCPCHEDQDAITEVARAVTDGLLTADEATDFVSGKQV
ncbi:MAG TPA: hypothetical protein VF043_12090 [Ktedonobacteraceae bacterium]